ncbi:RNA 2',3'-cyclic phosphodiesterase [Maricaulis salignorans]|uniref:RNA 2',3'-cyclic phosphodiesterase n=1 Tax=Maricaulis salignorans TaxID=144026 RepID=UPI003A8EF583
MSQRLFAAIGLPDSVCDPLLALQTGLPGASWRPRENLHLTLRFFGDIDERKAEDLEFELGKITAPAFDLTLKGAGWFGRLEPHALWIGAEPAPALLALQTKCERAARRAGLAAETRNFVPHVTLAYLRKTPVEALAGFTQALGTFRCDPVRISRFSLYASWFSRGDANIYQPVTSYPLG